MIRKLSILLCFFLTFAILSAQNFTSGGVKYKVTGTEMVEVTTSQTFTGDLVLPTIVTNNGNTYAVAAVATNAFFNSSGLTSIVISNSVTSIGTNAFYGCINLNSVSIPNSVTNIETSAFGRCTSLSSVVIPNSITALANGVFALCSNLTSVQIPTSVLVIGNSSFSGCSNLTSVVIPNSVTSIGTSAFNGCSNLLSVAIPVSVTSIGNSAFGGCSSLKIVICDIPTPVSINSNVFANVSQGTCHLVVPTQSVQAYKEASVWKFFAPITDSATLSTDEYATRKKVVIYPNPFHNEVFIDVIDSIDTDLQVVDLSGKVLHQKVLNKALNKIEVSNWPSGIYLFKTKSGKGASVTKIIKK